MISTLYNSIKTEKIGLKVNVTPNAQSRETWLNAALTNPLNSIAVRNLRELHAKIFADKPSMISDAKNGLLGVKTMIENLNAVLKFQDKSIAMTTREYLPVGTKEELDKLNRERLARETLAKNRANRPPVKQENVLALDNGPSKAGELVNSAPISLENLKKIQEKLVNKTPQLINISANITSTPVSARSKGKVEDLYKDAQDFMEDADLSNIMETIILKSNPTSPNRKLLVIRAVAPIKQIYDNVVSNEIKNNPAKKAEIIKQFRDSLVIGKMQEIPA